MKTRTLIIITLVGFLSLISITQIVQAVPMITFDDAYDYSELVIVGQIESVEILSEPYIGENISMSGIALYDVTILFSLKNPDNITEITIPGEFLREPHPMAYETYPFEVGQVVVLFIQPSDYVSGYDLVIRSSTSEVIYPTLEDGSECENHRYSYYNGYCMRTEIQNQDLPLCDQNPKHDFGKCERVFEEPNYTLQHILNICNSTGAEFTMQKPWWNTTHYIDTFDCKFLDKIRGSPTYGQPIQNSFDKLDELVPEPVPEYPTPENCGPGTILQDGICVVTSESKPDVTNGMWDNPYESPPISFDEPSHLIPNPNPDARIQGGIILMILFFGIVVCGAVLFVIWRRKK